VDYRFRLGRLLLERCGRQVTIEKLAVEEMWVTGSSWDRFCWRIAGDRFRSGELSLKTCGRKVRVGRVVVGEMWTTGSSS
jgi:hypothetical protein